MQLTNTIERTFDDVATTVEGTYATIAEHTPPPVDEVVTRVGAYNVGAIRHAGRFAVRSVEAVEGAISYVDARTSGLTGRVEATTLHLVGRASEELDGAITAAKTVAAKVDRRVDGAVDRAEAIADDVAEELDDVVDAAKAAGKTVLDRTTAAAKDVKAAADELEGKAAPANNAFETWSKADLYERAQELDIDGRSGMTKAQLIAALRA